MGIVGALARTGLFVGKVTLFVGTLQLTSELGVWGRDPHLAKARIVKFVDAEYWTQGCPYYENK